MIRSAQDLAEGQLLECDICISGAGAAGITLAVELSKQKFNVVMLESGGFEFDEEVQSLYQAQVNGTIYNDPEASRLRFFGGTTNHWAGNCGPLDSIDFERRDWLPYSGWPFSRADLDPYYERAQTYCQLWSFNYDSSHWQSVRGKSPLPLDPKKVITGITQKSPPTRFGEIYRYDLETSKNVFVYLYTNLIDINLSTDGNQVDTILAGGLDGKRFSVKAKKFVLALGGLENARMLLNCDKVHRTGIGNQYDLVGRYFMDHPVVSAATFLLADPSVDLSFYRQEQEWPPKPGVTNIFPYGYLSLSDAMLREHGLTNVRAPLIPISHYRYSKGIESMHEVEAAIKAGNIPDNLGTHIANIVRDIDMVIEGVSRTTFNTKLFSYADDNDFLFSDVMIEQRPEPSNRVSLLPERDRLGLRKAVIDWRLGDDDKDNLWRVIRLIATEFGRAGLGRVKQENSSRLFSELLSLGDHHMGTTRAHNDPHHGVVDANLKIHGVANLYIAGSSVFPTGGHVPPTLTIVALAIRLAEHLRNSVGGV